MKKKFVSIIIATMVSASVMAGCGSVSGNPTEDVMAETQLLEAVRKAAENNSSGAIEEALEAETGEALDIDSLENDMDEVVSEEPDNNIRDIAEKEQLDIDVVQKISDQLNPVAIAAVLNGALGRDEIPVKERELTIPIEISGSEASLNFDCSEVMDTITGGLYVAFDAVK